MAPASRRGVLEGVPRVGFYDGYGCPEDFPLPSSLAASLRFLAEDVGCHHSDKTHTKETDCTYAYMCGLTGAAWALLWHPDRWDMAIGNMLLIARDREEPVRRALRAVGRSHRMIAKAAYADQNHLSCERSDDEALYRAAIVGSIRDEGLPVLAVGVIGPPEVCLITGYDEAGEALIGWSCFQEDPNEAVGVEIEPSGYFRKSGWFGGMHAIILLGPKGDLPPEAQTNREALRWGLEVTHTADVHGYRSGLAAYDAWAEALLRDEQFPANDPDSLRQRHEVSSHAAGVVAEMRWYGSLFLRRVAQQEPAMAEHLNAAADCFVAEHDLMWAVWEFGGGHEPTEANCKKLAGRFTRERIEPLIRLSKQQDQMAAGHIEAALKLG